MPCFCLEYLGRNYFNESFRSIVSSSIVLEAFVLILGLYWVYAIVCIGLYAITVFYCIHDTGQDESN